MNILTATVARLEMLGYTVTEADDAAIAYNTAKAEATLKSDINQHTLPEGLFYAWADMAAGMFLLDKKSTGQLTAYTFEASVKSISEGDTSLSFEIGESSTQETQFDTLVAKLVHPSKSLLSAYRRVAW